MTQDMKAIVPGHIRAIEPYRPGRRIEDIQRERGLSDIKKMASNENPLGCSPHVRAAVTDSLEALNRYPDGNGNGLREKIALKMGLEKEHIVLGNGSDDLITMLARAFLREGDEAVALSPSFSMYGIAIQSAGARPVFAPLKSFGIDPDAVIDAVSPQTRMVFLCNPNNPTGTILTRERLEYLLERLPAHVTVVLDEAYIEFVRDPDCASGRDFIQSGRPVAALRTFSKIYGLAGLRVGYGMAPAWMADILNRIRGPFNTSSPAQAGACAALDDEDFADRSRKLTWEGLDFLSAALDEMGIDHVPSQANFLLMDVGDADAVFEKLLSKGIIARSMSGAGLPRHIRISAGLPVENQAFVDALKNILNAGVK